MYQAIKHKIIFFDLIFYVYSSENKKKKFIPWRGYEDGTLPRQTLSWLHLLRSEPSRYSFVQSICVVYMQDPLTVIARRLPNNWPIPV